MLHIILDGRVEVSNFIVHNPGHLLRYSDCHWNNMYLHLFTIKSKASGPITSWEIDEETVETVSDFILGGSKITADGDCSHEIKRCLLLGKKVMINLDSILTSRHYFVNKGPSSQGYGFSSSHLWM